MKHTTIPKLKTALQRSNSRHVHVSVSLTEGEKSDGSVRNTLTLMVVDRVELLGAIGENFDHHQNKR